MQVLDKAKDLVEYTITITDNYKYFSKRRRFTFVDRMQNLALNICDNLIQANETSKEEIEIKRSLQRKALSETKRLQFFIELSCRRGFINEEQLGIWAKHISNVRNLTAAWYKKTK